MVFKKAASAGSMDSCDISIRIESGVQEENQVYLSSVVAVQFGEHIQTLIHEMLDQHHIKGVVVNAVDKGALDCTIRARLACAITRSCEQVEVV